MGNVRASALLPSCRYCTVSELMNCTDRRRPSAPRGDDDDDDREDCWARPAQRRLTAGQGGWRRASRRPARHTSLALQSVRTYACAFRRFTALLRVLLSTRQGVYIFYAGGSLAGAGYCRQCRRRPAILPLQLWQGCQDCVKISAQRLSRVAQFYAC